jgi:sirohydrochlorin cobaltochelatase
MTPTLGDAVARLVGEGATRVDVVPLFLGTGGHLRDDLPPLVAALRAKHPGVAITLHAAIGEHAQVAEAMARAALRAAGFGE